MALEGLRRFGRGFGIGAASGFARAMGQPTVEDWQKMREEDELRRLAIERLRRQAEAERAAMEMRDQPVYEIPGKGPTFAGTYGVEGEYETPGEMIEPGTPPRRGPTYGEMAALKGFVQYFPEEALAQRGLRREPEKPQIRDVDIYGTGKKHPMRLFPRSGRTERFEDLEYTETEDLKPKETWGPIESGVPYGFPFGSRVQKGPKGQIQSRYMPGAGKGEITPYQKESLGLRKKTFQATQQQRMRSQVLRLYGVSEWTGLKEGDVPEVSEATELARQYLGEGVNIDQAAKKAYNKTHAIYLAKSLISDTKESGKAVKGVQKCINKGIKFSSILEALTRLGWSEDQAKTIIRYAAEK